MAALRIHRLRNDAHVADSCLLDRVHDRGEGAKRHIFVRAQEDRLVLRIANFLAETRPDLVDVDGIVAQKNSLRFVDADDEALFGDLFDGASVRDVDFDSGLQHGRGHHENDEQHEDDIHQRRDVDVGKRRLSASVGGGEGHQRRASVAGIAGWRSVVCVCRSTRLSISRVKSSLREAISRTEPMMRLYAITAGMAAASPAAVVIRASEIPGATARKVAAPAVPRPWKASMIPQTVPNNPINGVTAPVIASHGTLRSRRVISSEDAICMARWIATRLWMPPVIPIWRLNSSTAPANTPTSGLGRNCSATEAMSCMRCALRKARTKRPLCPRARRIKRHLERITAQESTLNAMSRRSTDFATGPV